MVIIFNNDDCVISKSNEVKDINIPMGTRAFDYPIYDGDMSSRVMIILNQVFNKIFVILGHI